MRNLKKILALVLALMMALSVMVFASAANYDDYSDKDQVSAEYAEAVEVLTGMDIFWGSENNFYPKSNVTRAEVATLIYRIMTGDITGDQVDIYADYGMFADVRTSNWFAGYVNYAANADLVVGVGDDNYNPQGNVTGYELITILLRAIGYDANDEISGSTWKITAASLAKQAGILGQFNESTLGSALTREQVAYLLFNAIQARKVNYTVAFGYQPSRLGYSIAWDMFQLAKSGTVTDNWGRPAYVWYEETNVDADPTAATTNISYDGPVTDPVYATIEATPLATYYTPVTQCDVAEAVNGGEGFTATTYENGKSTAGTSSVAISSTNTTATIGQQGRATEIYKVGDAWTIVYVDTFLGEVTAVTAPTYDTAGHVVTEGTMVVTVGTTPITLSGNDYAVGAHVLLNAYNSDTIPTVWSIVSAASSVDVTVTGIHHTNGQDDGVIANNTTYLTNYTYVSYNSCEYVALADSMITQNYRLYLDAHNNVVGMELLSGITENVGIITAMDYTRVGTDRYVANVELFLGDGTTSTLQFINETDDQYFAANEQSTNLGSNRFIRFQAVTLDGTTYYKWVETATQNTDADGVVTTGVTNTLDATNLVDDTTRFIVANYAYDYSKAETVLQGYSVYNGFKNVPVLTKAATGNVYYHTFTADVGGVQYVLLTSDTTAAYTQTAKTQQAVDTSALFISKGVTNQFYTVYNVVVNGTKTTVNVTNAVNTDVETNLGKVIAYTGLSNGYYTSVAAQGNIAANQYVSYADGVLTYNTNQYLTVADNCAVQIVNCTTEQVYSATLAHLDQYSTNEMSYELDANGYVCNLYIIQK